MPTPGEVIFTDSKKYREQRYKTWESINKIYNTMMPMNNLVSPNKKKWYAQGMSSYPNTGLHPTITFDKPDYPYIHVTLEDKT